MPAEILLELLPLIERKRRHTVIPFAENERVDAAPGELLAITRGDAKATLRVDGVLVSASKHPDLSTLSRCATLGPRRPTAVPQVRLEAVVYGLSSHFIPLDAGY